MTNPTDANGRQRTPTDAPRPLRETVADIVSMGEYTQMVQIGLHSRTHDILHAADAAIAAMVDALLSEAAVEAAMAVFAINIPATTKIQLAGQIQINYTDMLEAALHRIGATTDCGCTVTDVVDIDQCSRPGCPRAEGER